MGVFALSLGLFISLIFLFTSNCLLLFKDGFVCFCVLHTNFSEEMKINLCLGYIDNGNIVLKHYHSGQRKKRNVYRNQTSANNERLRWGEIHLVGCHTYIHTPEPRMLKETMQVSFDVQMSVSKVMCWIDRNQSIVSSRKGLIDRKKRDRQHLRQPQAREGAAEALSESIYIMVK